MTYVMFFATTSCLFRLSCISFLNHENFYVHPILWGWLHFMGKLHIWLSQLIEDLRKTVHRDKKKINPQSWDDDNLSYDHLFNTSGLVENMAL